MHRILLVTSGIILNEQLQKTWTYITDSSTGQVNIFFRDCHGAPLEVKLLFSKKKVLFELFFFFLQASILS